MVKKNPSVAAALNVLSAGLGYLYLGRRRLFGALLVVTDLIGWFLYYTDSGFRESAGDILRSPVAIGALVIYVAAFAIDAYQEAQTVK